MLISATFACRLFEKVDLGKIEGSTYTNRYFRMKISIPQGWQVRDEEAQKQISERGKEILANGNEQVRKSVEVSEFNTLHLLAISKYPRGSTVPSNPNFVCVAERINPVLSETSTEYLGEVKRLLQGGQQPYEFEGDIYSQFIDGQRFFVFSARNTRNGVRQNYYSTRMKDYNLSFIISYKTDEDLKALQEILDSVKFEGQE